MRLDKGIAAIFGLLDEYGCRILDFDSIVPLLKERRSVSD